MIEFIQQAEALGVDEIWLGDEGPARDPLSVLAAAAIRTRSIRLGVGITNPYVRHPAMTAVSMMTVHELSGGRAVLGLGVGGNLALGPGQLVRGHPRADRPAAVRLSGGHRRFAGGRSRTCTSFDDRRRSATRPGLGCPCPDRHSPGAPRTRPASSQYRHLAPADRYSAGPRSQCHHVRRDASRVEVRLRLNASATQRVPPASGNSNLLWPSAANERAHGTNA